MKATNLCKCSRSIEPYQGPNIYTLELVSHLIGHPSFMTVFGILKRDYALSGGSDLTGQGALAYHLLPYHPEQWAGPLTGFQTRCECPVGQGSPSDAGAQQSPRCRHRPRSRTTLITWLLSPLVQGSVFTSVHTHSFI